MADVSYVLATDQEGLLERQTSLGLEKILTEDIKFELQVYGCCLKL